MINRLASLLSDRNFILYCLIGVSGVALDLIIYFILVNLDIPGTIASFVSVSIAIINNFFLNAYFNFKKRDHLLARFASFFTVGSIGTIISVGFIFVLHQIFATDEITAKVISIPFVILMQYYFNKNASFANDSRSIPWRSIRSFLFVTAIVSISMVNAPYYNFTDEADNLLGAQHIAEGGVIYKDYFSHHTPLAYYVGSALFTVTDNNIIGVKILFALILCLWLFIMCRPLISTYGYPTYYVTLLLVTVSQPLTWSHMLLGETLVAYATLHATILFLTRRTKKITLPEVATYSVLAAIIPLSALSYTPLAVVIYGLIVYRIIEQATRKQTKQQLVRLLLCTSAAIAMPYVAFLSYLYMTGTGREFYTQAVKFNTQFYSQFTPDAPTSSLEALITIPQGAISSLNTALTTTEHGLLVSVFSVLFISCVSVLISLKRYIEAGLFILLACIGASRYGFIYVFSGDQDARSGMILSLLGILLLSICLPIFILWHKGKSLNPYRYIAIGVSMSFVLLLITASLSVITTNSRGYLSHERLTIATEEPGSPSRIVNLVNRHNDTYWVGPIDFASQSHIQSKNASNYRFFTPWIAACGECVADLREDLQKNQPNIIIWNTNLDIWGINTQTYGSPVNTILNDAYYQYDDTRLRSAFFSKDNVKRNTDTLERAGYHTTIKENL